MRLHRLTMTAFGPFRDEQTVDFDALSDAGLFLLTGQTGAGKTSVLDAVTYALYGQVPGGRAGLLRIRSDHADPGVPTVVTLELTVRGSRLRVRRTPDWDRPKKRGGGTTRERGGVLLERQQAGGWDFVSSRHDEVGHELAGLLGLTHDQFCQVVLLPQGAFASFLVADAEARKLLLERLFGTDRFSAVESWLASLRVVRGEAFSQQIDRRNELVARLAEVADDRDRPVTEAADDEVLFWADAVLAELGQRRAMSEQLAEQTAAARDRTEIELRAARDADAQQQRLRLLHERREQVTAGVVRRDAAEVELDAARRAAGLHPLLEAVDETVESHVAAHAQLERARGAVTSFGVAAGDTAEALRRCEHEIRAELTRLADLVVDAERLTVLTSDLEAVGVRLAAAVAARDVHRAELEAAPATRTALEAKVRASQLAQQRLAELTHDAARAAARATAAATRDTLQRKRVAVDRERSDALDRAQTARSHSLDLRERRLEGMAAELAAGLLAGAPCPVCGGIEHPEPAAGHETVSDADERRATADLVRAETALRQRDALVSRVAEDHAKARIAAGGDDDAAVLHAALAASTARRDEALRLAAVLAVALAAVRAHEDAVEAHRSVEQSALDEIRDGDARRLTLLAEQGELATRLTAARGSDADVPTRMRRLDGAADAIATAARALIDEDHVQRVHRAAEKRLDRAARAAGFADVAAAAGALRSEAQMEQLAESVVAYDRESAVVAAAFADPAVRDAVVEEAGVIASRLTAAIAARESAATTAEAAQGERGRLESAHLKALRLHGDLVSAVSRLTPLRADYEAADTLAKLASGTGTDNRLRMRLSYYVLSSRLEQVAEAASERLLRMSDGRFTLRHTDERSGGNQRSGLGLLVCDGWYGTTRDPATLSGGESFMASLSLALGLADVVVAEAGGTLMDTLFVDEGFGSLDDETLDSVLEVLDGLRDGGRAVGIVSHVGELRDRIPAQLAVRKAHHGSSLRLSA